MPVTERVHPRSLSVNERQEVLGIVNSERFWDQAPGEVYAALLDEGRYLCSERTMYRILAENQQVRERRDQLRHPRYQAPELLASGPNEVWSWDITKLLGPTKWTYFYLYVILDIFSRYVVGWMLAYRESAELAKKLIEQSIKREEIEAGETDGACGSGSVDDVQGGGVFTGRVGSDQDPQPPVCLQRQSVLGESVQDDEVPPGVPRAVWLVTKMRTDSVAEFFPWYNHEHHHSGLGYFTPYEVHYGLAEKRRDQRSAVLKEAYREKPPAFCAGRAKPRSVTDCGVDQQAQRNAFKRWAGTKFVR